jgi:isopentenyl-diphosphate delta-isomerase
MTELSYCARDEISGLVENEYLHVFHGRYAGEPRPDPDEVGAWRWMSLDRVRRGLASRPGWFTPWFAFLATMQTGD